MTSHLAMMVFFAACVAVVFGTLMRDGAGAELRTAGRIFAALVGGALVVGWLMFGLFR
jgi:hypothetical protein